MVVVLILLSQFKQDILIMSANFVDIMLIDADTISFLLTIFPRSAAGRSASPRRSCVPLLAAAVVARSVPRAVADRRRSARRSCLAR